MCGDCSDHHLNYGIDCGELKICPSILSFGFDDQSTFGDLNDIESLLLKLRDLLTSALPDDLLDDDVSSSLSSSLSPDKSSPEPWQEPISQQQQLPDWVNNIDRLRSKLQQHQQQTSTPQAGQTLPPLKTPAAFQNYDYYSDHGNQNGDYTDIHNPRNGFDDHHHQTTNHNMVGYDRGEVEGANSDDEYHHQGNQQEIHAKQNGVWTKQSDNQYNDGGAYTDGDYEQQYGDTSNSEQFHSTEQFHSGTTPNFPKDQQNGRTEQHYGPAGDSKLPMNHPANNDKFFIDQENLARSQNGLGRNDQGNSYGSSTSVPRPITMGVQYKEDRVNNVQQNGTMHPQWTGEGGEQKKFRINPMPGSHVQQVGVVESAQQQFLEAANDEHSRQTAQLEILYKAKSRELEQVSRQLENIKEESAREKRILNHQLAMVNGEKDGLSANFGQSRELLVTCQDEKQRLEEQHQVQCDQMKTLMASQEELLEKYQNAQCTIENLAQQLQAVQMSETHSKLSRDRDDLLANIQEKNQQELNVFREKLDKATKAVDEKDNEMRTLQEEMHSLRKTLDQTRIEHAEVVNKLSKSLEESQTQCRQYLESGNLDEVSRLKLQLKQTSTTRDMSQEVCKSLQEELQDLQEQVQMYESAASLGVLSSKVSPKGSSESFAHLGVRNLNKEEWETPLSSRSESSGHPAGNQHNKDTAMKLRTELERALSNNNGKRHQVKQLQEQLKLAKEECKRQKQQAEEDEFKIKDLQVQIKTVKSDAAGNLTHKQLSTVRFSDSNPESRRMSIGSIEARRNTLELWSVKEDCEELKKKLEKEVGDNVELKQQMVEMVSEHDEDKQSTLDRVQNTCIQLHEDRSKQFREHLVTEWESERDMLKEAHQHQMQEIRSELETIQKELLDVKEDYLAVCEEKNEMEDAVTKRLNVDAANKLTKTIADLNAATESSLADLRQTLENEHRIKLLSAKTDWQKVADQRAAKQFEIKLAEAHVEWNATARKQATESTKQAIEAEWDIKLDDQVKERLAEELTQAKQDLELKYKEDLQAETHQIKIKLDEKHKHNLQATLADAEKEWNEKSAAILKQKVQDALQECNNGWLDGKANIKEMVEEKVAEEKEKWLTETVDLDEVKSTWMNEKGQVLIEKEVAQAKQELERRHGYEMAELQRKYDKLDCERREVMKKEAEKMQKDHEEFLAEHKETMIKAIQATQSTCQKDQVELLHQKSSEFEQTLAEKENLWRAERQELVNRHKQDMETLEADILEKLEEERDALTSEQEVLREKHKQEMDTALSQANKECDTELRETFREELGIREEAWKKEKEDLIWQLQGAEKQLHDLEDHAHQNIEEVKARYQQMQQQTEVELKDLRHQLRTSQTELQQTEHCLKQELHNLQSQLTSTNSATMEALEGRMRELQKKHARAVLKLKEHHGRERDSWNRRRGGEGADSVSREIQTDAVADDTSHNGLNELRAHYLSTVEKIRSDVLKYVTDMREQCRQTVHTEVKKERNSTARKLRQYYLQCLHQLTQEEKSTENTTLSKFIAMATALELPEDGAKPVEGKQTSSRRPDSQSSQREASRPSSRGSSQQSSRPSSRQSSRSSSPDLSNYEACYENRVTESAFKPIREQFTPTNSHHASTMPGNTIPDSTCHGTHSDSVYMETSPSEVLQTDSFRRLSRQPREFNPSPERLRPTTQMSYKSADHATLGRGSDLSNVTVRSKIVVSPEENSTQRNQSSLGESLRVRQELNLHNRDDLDNKVPLCTRSTYTGGDTVTNVTQRVHQDLKFSHVSSKLAVTMPEPGYCTTGLGQRSKTSTSSVSLATEYNDLPNTLNVENQYPEDCISQTGKLNNRDKSQFTESNSSVTHQYPQSDYISQTIKRNSRDKAHGNPNVYRSQRSDLTHISYKDQKSSMASRATEPLKRTSHKGDSATSQMARAPSNKTTSRSAYSTNKPTAQAQHGKSALSSSLRTNAMRTSDEQAKLQGCRVSKHAATLPGAHKQYGTSRYQDSGFDSPHIDQ